MTLFPRMGVKLWILLIIIFGLAFCARLYRIDDTPLKYHPTRQYQTALLTRAYYYSGNLSIEGYKRHIAALYRDQWRTFQPPILESLVATAYRLIRTDDLRVPQFLSILFWLTGGIVLFLLTVRLASPDAAIVCVMYYLFLPWAVMASRSFQIEPLMVMLMIAAIYAIYQYSLTLSSRALLVAALAASAAIFVKPVCLFSIYGAFLAGVLTSSYRNPRNLAAHCFFFLCVSAVPSTIYYGYGLLVSGNLIPHAVHSAGPQLWWSLHYWKGWIWQIGQTVGYVPWLAALLGIVAFRNTKQRVFVAALWTGYLLNGLMFSTHVLVHDYDQLVLVPIVAISLAPWFEMFTDHLSNVTGRAGRLFVYGVLALAVVISVGLASSKMARVPSGIDRDARFADKIGDIVDHSPKTIFLTNEEYGDILMYYGHLVGVYWPHKYDRDIQELYGRSILSAADRLERKIQESGARYFIVTNLPELESQQDLKMLLVDNFSTVARNDDFWIFQLKGLPTQNPHP